jgi:hypothetical protein
VAALTSAVGVTSFWSQATKNRTNKENTKTDKTTQGFRMQLLPSQEKEDFFP